MTPNPAGTLDYADATLNACLDRLLTTVDRTVLSRRDLELAPNTQYEQAELLDLLTHIAVTGDFANGGAKTRRLETDRPQRVRTAWRSPVAKALGYHLRRLDRKTIRTQFAAVFAEQRTLAKKARLLTQPVDLAVDVHDWLYYGDAETEMVANTNPSQGTATAYKFVTACIVTNSGRLTVGVEPVADKTHYPEALDAVLSQAKEWAPLRRVFLDRGFYRVSVLQVLEAHDVAYVMRAPRYQSLRSDPPRVQVDPEYKVTQSYPPHEWVRLTRFAVPHREAPKEKHTFFVTNMAVPTATAQSLAESYRRRRGIETSYRVLREFLPKSRSRRFSVRLFYFLFAITLYNVWVLVNRLLAIVLGPRVDQASPVISAAVIGRLLRARWLTETVCST